MNLLSQNLKVKRKNKNWTQKEAAYNLSEMCKKKIKLSRYQAWEEGRSTPNYIILSHIAKMYETTVDEMIFT